MKNSPLLKALQDGAFHSGERLAEALGVTRAAVWKSIQQLQQAGLPIESQQGRGYCLQGGIELLDKDKIQAELSKTNQAFLAELILHDSIPSTNDFLLEYLRKKPILPVVSLAEQQMQGRGRRGRSWVSPYGNNIYFSLAWHFDKDPAELLGLSLVSGIIIINSLKRYGLNEYFYLKWPNDVLWQDRKLAGVLVEVMAQSNESCKIVLGIGINTQLPPTTQIDQAWVSLDEITGSKIERNRLAGILLDESISTFKDFEMKGLASYIKQWNEYDYCKDRSIKLQQNQENIQGIGQGISERGELLLLDEKGQLRKFLNGEIQKGR